MGGGGGGWGKKEGAPQGRGVGGGGGGGEVAYKNGMPPVEWFWCSDICQLRSSRYQLLILRIYFTFKFTNLPTVSCSDPSSETQVKN